MTISLIMTKQGNKLDAGLRKQAFTFLQKITEDDTLPGLHIEPIKGAVDPRVRTGRVDQGYRAVLFKLTQGRDTTYVFHGIFPHDEANRLAERIELRVNPLNGMPEIRSVEEERAAAGLGAVPGHALPSVPEPSLLSPGAPSPADAASDEPPAASELTPSPSEPASAAPLITVDRATLLNLGLPDTVADAALVAHTEQELAAATTGQPEWQHLVLVGLAAGMTPDEVKADLAIEPFPAALEASDDTALLDSLAHPSASIEFARIDGVDELRRVIEGGDFGAWRVFLHPEQRRFAEQDTSGAFRLSGGAGTGKTVVLLHRARRLARRRPDARVVLTTYTVNLAAGMRRDLQRLDPDIASAAELGEAGALVSGIDALARQVLRRAGASIAPAVEAILGVGHAEVTRVTSGAAWAQALSAAGQDLPEALRSPKFVADEYGLVVLPGRLTTLEQYLRARRPGRGVRLSRAERAAVWRVIEAYRVNARIAGTVDFAEAAAIAAAHLDLDAAAGAGRPADHVLVDEGQDLGPTHWQLLRALVETGPDDLFIAEDSHQRIYGAKITLGHYGIAIRGRSRRLTLNYRTTAQNLQYAVSVLAGGDYHDLEDGEESTAGYRSARTGPKPVLQGCATLTEELDFAASVLADWLAEPGVQPETLAVLVRDSQQRELVANGLAERGVQIRAVDREDIKPGRPVVMTMHRAKGTEFARVVLFEVSAGSIPLHVKGQVEADRADANLRERSLLYVAASRARDELVVTWSGEASELLP